MDNEKRRYSRSPCRIEAVVEAQGAPAWSGPCRDISLKGLFLPVPAKAQAGAPCRVTITLSNIEPPIVLAIRGRVARADSAGAAIEFDAMDAESRAHLQKIVLYNSPDPDRALRESEEGPGRP